ncbi:hypothetical protein [Vallitalea okinawensis]|uniref:hypothetical protein n=1 Tax=Vallitalea okinawensis TaxID=2078660 RepID=UPI000CFB37F0|nr:hypothetical protein [Vallitalea okinawensis]
MNTVELLSSNKLMLLVLSLMFFTGLVLGEIIFRINKEKALKWGNKLDSKRDVFITIVHKNMLKSYGVLRVIIIIFGINLFGGALIWSSIGGIFVVFPFIHYILIGFLTNLVLKRFPERKNWLTVPNIILEVAAFIIAAVGGINIGLSIWGNGNIYLAVRDWGVLFITLVIPCQLIAAIFEGFLFRKIHIIEKHPWPREISKESNM